MTLLVAPPFSYRFLFGIALFFFISWVIALVVIHYAAMRTPRDVMLILCLFFTSLGFIFLVHEIGYFDHIGLLAALLCLIMPAGLTGALARLLICCVMIMVHEAFFILFFPAIVFDFLYAAKLREYHEPTALSLAAIFIIPTVVLTWMAGDELPAPVQVDQMNEYLAAKAADFDIRPGASAALIRGGEENLQIAAHIWRSTTRWAELALSWSVTMPLVLFWLWHSMTLLRNAIRGSRLMKTLLYVLCATSCLSPLFLHALAWDLQRFNCLAQVTGFLVFTSLRYRSKASGKALQLHSSTPTLVLASMFMLNVSAGVPLLNRYEVARPPFWRHFYHLRAYVKGDTPFVVVPGTQQMPRQRAADQLRGAGGAKRRSTLRASCRCGSGTGSRWTRSTRHRLLTTTAFRLVSMDVV